MRSISGVSGTLCWVVFLVSVLLPHGVVANDGPYAAIHKLFQKDQDVKVTLAIPTSGNLETAYTLGRIAGDDLVLVLDGHVFGESDIVDTVRRCNWAIDIEWCAAQPSLCVDCDEDGVLECRVQEMALVDCWMHHLVKTTDECVPPGDTMYDFLTESLEHMPDTQSAWINVLDSDVDCGDCSCHVPGAPQNGFGLLELLAAVI